MITEDYVSFETAKLLKEKGYCNISIVFYKENGELVHYNVPLNNNGFSDTLGVFYEAPTLQMVMKWLREVHNYNIEIDTIGQKRLNTLSWRSVIYNLEYDMECYYEDNFKSYEEACEAAIKYCLENLI